MHTDEYEISLGREVALCRKYIKLLKSSLSEWEKQYGMATEDLLRALEEGRLNETSPSRKWREVCQDLYYWQKMLNEYEDALGGLMGM